jgi:hypothetical protein
MALIKETAVDQITVTENGTVLVRKTTAIKEDGVELSKTYNRTSFEPEADLTGQPANVVAICNAAWTPEIIAAFKVELEARAALTASQVPAAE